MIRLPKQLFTQEYFGLSLSQTAMRAVTVTVDKQIKTSAQIPLSGNIFQAQESDRSAFAEALKQLMMTAKISTQYAAVCIPDYYSFTRIYTIPKINLSDVTEALSWQIEKIFPLPRDQIYFDWKLLSQDDKELTLLVVAMARETLDRLISLFEEAGVKALAFEPAASALTRTLSSEVSQAAILIEFNPLDSCVTLVENGISTLTVTQQFSTASADVYTKNALENTITGITSLLNYYANKHDSSTNLKLILSGDSATQELADWLTANLQRQVVLHTVPGVPVTFQQAFAVAMSRIDPTQQGIGLNLLPTSLREVYLAVQKQQSLSNKSKIAIFASIISLVISCGFLSMLLLQNMRLQSTLEQLETSNAQFGYDAQLVANLNKNSRKITTLFPKKNTQVESFNELFTLTPQTVTISSVDYDAAKQVIQVTGVAKDRASLLEFKQKLENSARFKTVSLPLESLEKPVDINYELSVTIIPFTNKP